MKSNSTHISLCIAFLFFLPVITFAQSGVAFRDYNNNGIKDTYEPGVKGVIVKSYKVGDVLYGNAVTAGDGTYTLSPAASAGQPLRIEFEIPSSASNFYGAVTSIDKEAPNGVGTAVQFTTGIAANINYAINNPANYVTSGSRLAASSYVGGDAVDPGANMRDFRAIAEFSYGLSGSVNKVAEACQVGSIWALSYSKRQKKLYAAACLKRHAGLGPLGIDGIYKMNITAPYNPVKFIELNDDYGINVGSVAVNGAGGRGLSPYQFVRSKDSLAYWQATQVGIGGMDLSEDEKYLYLVNLYDKKLYRIETDADNNPATAPALSDITSYAIPSPGCSNSDYQPYALKVYRNRIYVGVVCTALTSQNAADLKATVYSFDGSSFTQVLNTPLNYAKGSVVTICSQRNWNPWVNALPFSFCGSAVIYPQPVLSDIDFDNDGSMVLGFFDRTAFQTGHNQWLPNYPSNTNAYEGRSGGDMLRAYNNNGVFEMESNGKEGISSAKAATAGAGNNEGPGGGEFYFQDWQYSDAFTLNHSEVATGSILVKPGEPHVLSSAFDPLDGNGYFYSGGLVRLNNNTGVKDAGLALTWSHEGGFGKSVNMGDLELIDELPPIEIGNRIWNDLNNNGIQDAGEPGFANITIELYNGAGSTLLASTTTDANGNWYFNASNVSGGLSTFTNYKVRIAKTQFNNAGLSNLSGYLLAIPNRTGNGLAGYTDSDAFLKGDGSAEIDITTGDYGFSNHNIDFGMVNSSILPNETITLKVAKQNNMAQIQWQVQPANEFGNYQVEYSSNGINFKSLGEVVSVTSTRIYSFEHKLAETGMYYYRIKTINSAGKAYYTAVQSLVWSNTAKARVYPNPAPNVFYIDMPLQAVNKKVQVEVVNLAGQTLISRVINNTAGRETVPVATLAKGMYYVKLLLPDGIAQTEKICIK